MRVTATRGQPTAAWPSSLFPHASRSVLLSTGSPRGSRSQHVSGVSAPSLSPSRIGTRTGARSPRQSPRHAAATPREARSPRQPPPRQPSPRQLAAHEIAARLPRGAPERPNAEQSVRPPPVHVSGCRDSPASPRAPSPSGAASHGSPARLSSPDYIYGGWPACCSPSTSARPTPVPPGASPGQLLGAHLPKFGSDTRMARWPPRCVEAPSYGRYVLLATQGASRLADCTVVTM